MGHNNYKHSFMHVKTINNLIISGVISIKLDSFVSSNIVYILS